MSNSKTVKRLALASYLSLIAIVLLWELALAPTTPVGRGFWAAMKTLPLWVPLYWLCRASAQAHFYAALLMLYYFSEGVAGIYVMAKTGTTVQFAAVVAEAILALVFIVCAAYYVRLNLHRATARAPE